MEDKVKRLTGILTLIIIMTLVLSCKPDGSNPGTDIPDTYFVGDPIVDLLFTSDEIWVGTTGGVVRCNLSTGATQIYTVVDGLGSNKVRKLAQDSYGNIWAACQTAGVSRFDGTEWKNFTVDDGLISNDVITIEGDRQGMVWVSAYWGVSYYNGTGW